MSADWPTGAQLVEELRLAAKAKGVPLSQFIAPLTSSHPPAFIIQLGLAARPMPRTVERVRALIAGLPIPEGRKSPFSGAGRQSDHPDTNSREVRLPGEIIDQRRRLTERAHAERLPGETLQHAVRRLSGAAR